MATFNFSPERNVPVTLPRDPTSVISMNGWQFTARPNAPFQRKFKIMLHGMTWYLDRHTGFYDEFKNPTFNARALEKFYQEHETWKPFLWIHQHLGYKPIECRFSVALAVPEALPDSGGLIGPLEVTLIEHNPGF